MRKVGAGPWGAGAIRLFLLCTAFDKQIPKEYRPVEPFKLTSTAIPRVSPDHLSLAAPAVIKRSFRPLFQPGHARLFDLCFQFFCLFRL